MKKQGILSIFLSIVLFVQLFSINTVAGSSIATWEDNSENMKGVWVSTVFNLDYPTKATTDSSTLKSQADSIISNCKDLGFNAIFLQVRPTSDALYKSNIYPWSQYLTGSQGTAPDDDFDPLAYWVEKCHANGIELHAWINPYKATRDGNKSNINNLANLNPAKQHPEYLVKHSDGNYYYDPALPEVRQLVVDGIMEIVQNYDVDGIHMDDYFYPESQFEDDASYAKYGNGEDRGDWRRENVNKLVKLIHDTLDENNFKGAFGISPAGVWANKDNNSLGSNTRGSESYYSHYADSRKWAREEWIDYICPQIYWEIGHSAADYITLVDWWSQAIGNATTKLYIGIGDYRCDGVGQSSVWYNGKGIKSQLDYNRSVSRVAGEVHFRYGSIINNSGLYNVVKECNSQSVKVNDNIQVTEATTQITTQQVIETTTQPTTNQVVEEPTVEITTQNNVDSKFDPTKVINNDPYTILVYVNGEKLDFDQDPILKNNRTLVPFRKIFEALGAEVEWNNDKQQVRATLDDTEISFVIGESIMLVNKKDSIKLDTPAEIIRNRTFVPLRAISESLGADVEWYQDNRVITIDK